MFRKKVKKVISLVSMAETQAVYPVPIAIFFCYNVSVSCVDQVTEKKYEMFVDV